MLITYFYRKPSPVYHSIESLFNSFTRHIEGAEIRNHFSKYQSKGLINRMKIGLEARKNQSEINHITGDIHFIALFLKKKNTVLTIHDIGSISGGNIIKRFILELFWFRLPFLCVKHVTVISEFTKKEILSKFNISPDKITVINNCISDKFQFINRSQTNNKPVILQIGTKENKNLIRVIDAIKSINCKLLIIGKLKTDQEKLLKLFKIDYENCYNIPEDEMIQKYAEADMLLFTSTYEGFGMPIIEANAMGCPVITSDIEPMKSVANDAALLVDPYNTEKISEAIKNLLKDDSLRKVLIEKGLENAKKYRADFIARQYCQVYHRYF